MNPSSSATPARFDPPFRTGEVVADDHFTDRAREVAAVSKAMRSSGRLLLVGERRQGKSSILRQAGLHARARGAVIVSVDLWTATRLEEVLRRIVAAVPWSWTWRERLQTMWTGIGLTLGVRADPMGNPTFTVTSLPGELSGARARELLPQLIGRLDGVAAESREPVALVLDEFQSLERLESGAAALLRSAVQESHALAFVCAGSTVGLIDELVGPSGPLHGIFESLTVGPIEPAHLARWIEDRMRSRGVDPEPGAGLRIVEWAGPTTEDVLRLARASWEAGVARGGVGPEEVEAAGRRIVLDRRAAYERVWVELAESQRGVLRALASGEAHLTSRETIRRYGLPTGAAVLKAVHRLRARHLLAATADVIADPFFQEWILMDAMPDGRR